MEKPNGEKNASVDPKLSESVRIFSQILRLFEFGSFSYRKRINQRSKRLTRRRRRMEIIRKTKKMLRRVAQRRITLERRTSTRMEGKGVAVAGTCFCLDC